MTSTSSPTADQPRSGRRRDSQHGEPGAIGRRLDPYAIATVVLIALGAALRLRQFASDRALWLDEAFLWLNLEEHSALELTGRLDLGQGAPIPFLLASKAALETAGDSEWSLRLVPLILGLAVLPLAWAVAHRFLEGVGVPVAVGLIALSDPLVYYSDELKQYIGDVLVALILLWAAHGIATSKRLAPWHVAAFAGLGAVAIWLSHPATLVLAGVGLVLLVAALRARAWSRLLALGAAISAWIASFAALAVVHLPDLATLSSQVGAAVEAEGESRADSFAGNIVPGARILLEGPLGLPLLGGVLLAALVLLGIAHGLARRRTEAALLVAPIAVATIAVVLREYPAGTRFLLFLAPSLAILAAMGVEGLLERLPRVAGRVSAAIAAGAVLVLAAIVSLPILVEPIERQELDEVTDAISARLEPGDRIYVQHAAQYAFAYYGPRSGIEVQPVEELGQREGGDEPVWRGLHGPVLETTQDVVVGRYLPDVEDRVADVDRALTEPGRVWLVFSHRTEQDEVEEQEQLLERAIASGRVLDTKEAEGARAVLVEIAPARDTPAQG